MSRSPVDGTPMEERPARSKSRAYPVVWLALGLIMGAMYLVNGIEASSNAYLVVAFGWAMLGVAQWWRWRAPTASTGGVEGVARRRTQVGLYLTVLAFLVIAGGVAARWWA